MSDESRGRIPDFRCDSATIRIYRGKLTFAQNAGGLVGVPLSNDSKDQATCISTKTTSRALLLIVDDEVLRYSRLIERLLSSF